MITRSAQDWTPGSTVKVGFMTLEVIECIATPGDHRPDEYRLRSPKGKLYVFTPHHGLVAE